MRADNSRHLVSAAERRSKLTREKAVRALRHLDATGQPITIESLARQAGVSRSWLYGQPDLLAEIDKRRGSTSQTSTPVPVRQRASDDSLRSRLQAAQERVRTLTAENKELREQLAAALGELRSQHG